MAGLHPSLNEPVCEQYLPDISHAMLSPSLCEDGGNDKSFLRKINKKPPRQGGDSRGGF
jgi:hypothetical protein